MKTARGAAILLIAVTLIVATANAQPFPMALTIASLSGTNGDTGFPRARVGETVDVQVGIWNFGDIGDIVTVNSVSLVIQHGKGDSAIPNLLTTPKVLEFWGDYVVVGTNFVVEPDDPDILHVAYNVEAAFGSDGTVGAGSDSRPFSVQFGCQIVILNDNPPHLKMTRTTPDRVNLSWSIASEGFQLESSDDLGRNWTTVPATPAIRNGEFMVTVALSGRPNQFYRLARP